MKRLLTLLVVLVLTYVASSQNCPPYYHFYTQADIDNFQTLYPNCSQIDGSVLIDGMDITNLNGLNQLTSIGGDLMIGTSGGYPHNPFLENLNGLNKLTFIGGDLVIGIYDGYPHNPMLKDLNGLNNLAFIGGNLNINSNFSMETLTGLENLTSVPERLTIYKNINLRRLTGLNNVTTVGGRLTIDWNDSLHNLSGLNNLISVGGDLEIGGYPYYGNISMTSLTGIDSLTSIGGFLQICGNYTLTSLAGLDNIDADSVTGLRICNNISLSNCEIESICNFLASPNGMVDIFNNASGCNSDIEASIACGITSPCLPAGNYNISSQADIDNFQTVYPNCTDLEGIMKIVGNDITDLSGLNGINSVERYFWIEKCDSLTNLTGLTNLSSIGQLFIRDNASLISIVGLESLDSVGGWIDISDNAALDNLSGLELLTNIKGELTIWANYALKSLTGLENLKSIEHNLTINHDTALISLAALENLSSIGGDLYINNCNALTDLIGLDSLDPGSIFGLHIINNDNLSDCAIQSVCEFIAIPNGTIDIHDNAPGCNTQAEVEAACGVGLDENNPSENLFTIFPNPSSTQITIETSALPTKFQISIFNLNGQEVIRRQITESRAVIDISDLPGGIYFVRLTGQRLVSVEKFVKMD